ncbi:MAG: acetolactate synthase small subunit [Acutalibacteraceae bacterium]
MQYTLSILVENQAGVLSKISGLFSRRGFNIDSLAVGVTTDPNVSRITIVANGDEYVVEQLEKQLNKLIPVIKVKRLADGDFISRELILIKVHCPANKRGEILTTVELMQGKVVDFSTTSVTVEYCECTSRVDTLVELLKPYGIREIVRTGTVALDKGATAVSV